ncbi:ABC transporter substrate-binding protein [Lederbergia citri]|nr:sugar ABC transporter substrate-binding protein [Lederbergia citri]
MKKKYLIWFVFILSLVLLTACSSEKEKANSDGGKKEITVWTWPNNDQTFEEITVPLFEEEFPDIKVKVQAFPQGDYHKKLASALVANEGPDVAMVEIGNVINFKDMGMFENLNDAPYNASEYKDGYLDYFWDYASTKDGYVFALPKNSGPAAMFYNKRVFKDAGLPTDPDGVHDLLKTWDDYIDLAEKLSISGKQWMLATPHKIVDAIVQQSGTSYFNGEGELLIDNEHFLYSYKLIEQLYAKDAIAPFEEWSPEWNASIQNGTVATYLYGNWFGKYLKNNAEGSDGEWGVTYAPSYNGKSAYDNGGDFIGIVKTSKKKESAWEFVKFVTQNHKNLEEMYKKDDLYPTYLEVLDEDWMNNEDSFFGGQITNEIFKNVAEDMAAPFVTTNDPIASDGIKSLITNFTIGEMKMEEALDQAIKEIEARKK